MWRQNKGGMPNVQSSLRKEKPALDSLIPWITKVQQSLTDRS